MTEHTAFEYEFSIETEITGTAESIEKAKEKIAKQHNVAVENITLTNKTPLEELTGPTVELSFTPQRKHRQTGDISRADAHGETTFTVPIEAVQSKSGGVMPSPSFELDELKTHERAPLWIQHWSGPYDLRINEVNGLPEEYWNSNHPIDEYLAEN